MFFKDKYTIHIVYSGGLFPGKVAFFFSNGNRKMRIDESRVIRSEPLVNPQSSLYNKSINSITDPLW